jgi:hypothetical protein
MWHLWWIKWNLDRFFSEYFGFPLALLFHSCFVLIFVFKAALNNGPSDLSTKVGGMQCVQYTSIHVHAFLGFNIIPYKLYCLGDGGTSREKDVTSFRSIVKQTSFETT